MMLVFTLMFVIVLMYEASKPKNWNWFFNRGQENPSAELAPIDPTGAQVNEINTLLPRKAVEAESGIEGEFRIVKEEPKTRLTPYTMNQHGDKAEAEWLPGIEPDYYQKVEDDTFFILKDRDAWQNTFQVLRDTDQEDLEKAKALPAQFAQLHLQPTQYRGKLVELDGTIRRVVKASTQENDLGIPHYWQLWLFSDRHTSPIVIYALELPEDFPQGETIYQPVSLRGVFFKRWAYSAKGGTMTAPLVLAKQIQWDRPQERNVLSSTQIIIGVSISFTIAFMFALFVYLQSQGKSSAAEQVIRSREERKFREHADEIDPGISVRDQLKLLTAQLENQATESVQKENE
ncbi:MAG: hypothetical protein COA78_18070 [Blastopirellula sp.]|nr:MAG: hypothetical protein COA78_18070 [Blastopirellula sp.]